MSTTLGNLDEIVCMLCSTPDVHPMSIKCVRDLGRVVFCSVCGNKQKLVDKIHACQRNDRGHKKNAYIDAQNKNIHIGHFDLIICYNCRVSGRDCGISWNIKRNYWKRKVRCIKND